MKPIILVTNDDGIRAPGLKHLCQSIATFADVYVVAPSTDQTAVSLSITIRRPLQIDKADWFGVPAWHISGTPADCVKMGLNVILKKKPDMVISGINHGSNAGRNVLYSGTVAAAIESIIHEIPAIAFSSADESQPDYAGSEKYIPTIVRHVMENPLPKGSLLNVNFPNGPSDKFQGIKLTRQGKELWIEDPNERFHPFGHSYFWLGAKIAKFKETHDSDIFWLNKGYITAVPIHVEELTDHKHLEEHKQKFEDLF